MDLLFPQNPSMCKLPEPMAIPSNQWQRQDRFALPDASARLPGQNTGSPEPVVAASGVFACPGGSVLVALPLPDCRSAFWPCF